MLLASVNHHGTRTQSGKSNQCTSGISRTYFIESEVIEMLVERRIHNIQQNTQIPKRKEREKKQELLKQLFVVRKSFSEIHTVITKS